MNSSKQSDPIAWEAARLALLALRACIHASMPLSSDAYALASDRATVLTAHAMAPLLLAAAKPLVSRATVSRGVVVVHWTPPRERTLEGLSYAAARHVFELRINDESWSQMPFVRDRAEAAGVSYDRATVLCATRDETLLVSAAAVDRWEREYVTVCLRGYGTDDVRNPLADHVPAYREARARGAVALLHLGEPLGGRGERPNAY